jgi:predicted ATPase/class 3 adenylate cyclase
MTMASSDLPSGAVTLLLTDIEASTRKWLQDPAAAMQAQARHNQLIEEIVDAGQGKLMGSHGEGDSAFAAFSKPSDAVACALALQRAFDQEEWPGGLEVKIRIGLHTGEIQREREAYFGHEVSRCARIRSLAWGGQVLVSDITARLAGDALPDQATLTPLGSYLLKDFDGPQELFQLCHPALARRFPPLQSSWRRHNLPAQLSTFIGREAEVRRTRELLEGVRLLSLVGSGGCGKTRLALEVATLEVEDHADGVWLVELAALTEGKLLPQTVAAALGIVEDPQRSVLDTLKDHLRSSAALLILDNCEHLLEACAQLARDLLGACSDLKILATSRSPLGVIGEMTWTVPSLGVPDSDSPSIEELRGCDAVRLFVDRARMADPNFELNDDNTAAVVQTCKRLDGIPLAIELAAARTRVFDPRQIAERLNDRFKLLSTTDTSLLPRQQTLRAAVDWSHDLLSEEEKLLFRRLSVFPGSFSLEAAEAVCGFDQLDLVSVLAQLIEKSLVIRDGSGRRTRYSLLETTRDYAREKAQELGETDPMRDRLWEWAAELVKDDSVPDAEQLDLIEVEHDNLRAALGWGIKGPHREIALRMTGPLWRFWYMRGHLSEGRAWIIGLLTDAEGADPAARADALHTAGILAYRQRDTAAALAFHGESLELRRSLDDSGAVASSLNNLGLIALERQELDEAERLFTECLELRRRSDDQVGMASPLNNLGLVAHERGDHARAFESYQASLAIRRRFDHRWGIGIVLDNLGRLEFSRGNHQVAAQHHYEALTMWTEVGDEVSVADCLEHLARVALADDPSEHAVVLFAAAASIRERVESPLGLREREQRDVQLTALKEALGATHFEEAWSRGAEMKVRDAVRFASELNRKLDHGSVP